MKAYELVQAGENTFYIDCTARMGLYRLDERRVGLIDTGLDAGVGKKILRLLAQNGWELSWIINTHFHVDHIGGNRLLQERTGCRIYAAAPDTAFIETPMLEPSLLYGGYPCAELRGKAFAAQPSQVTPIARWEMPPGFEVRQVDGHSFAMLLIRTPDEIWFIADALLGEETLHKYHVSYLYEVQGYLRGLDTLETLRGKLFIPAHAAPTADLGPLARQNRDKAFELIGLIKALCVSPLCFEDVLKGVFDHYRLRLDFSQYALCGSAIRSYLSYLHDRGELYALFEDNRLLWQSV